MGGKIELYHANMFELVKAKPLPVFIYNPDVQPKPKTLPQLYQILGSIAKKIINAEKKVVVTAEKNIESLVEPITDLGPHSISIGDQNKFIVKLTLSEQRDISIETFEFYKLLINRLVDVALTKFSDQYFKFHPDAPYIIKNEPYFDVDLINNTGIIDYKKYYRALYQFDKKLYLLLNRETELRSHQNLLNEIKCLKNKFDSINNTQIDFYEPPIEFVKYVNSMLRGKSAEVIRYPGPRIRWIKSITWEKRGKDILSGSKNSTIDYLGKTYGVTGLDENQPLIEYEVGENRQIHHHVPEALSVGHNFHDLEKRIPTWQRTQVWGTIHPDCKNQMQKIFGLLIEIDKTLRKKIPDVYPELIEISTKPMEISSVIAEAPTIRLKFGNKEIDVGPKYDEKFYQKYSGKQVKFHPGLEELNVLAYVEKKDEHIEFLEQLKAEYLLRVGHEMKLVFEDIDFDRKNFDDYNFVLTIVNDESKNKDEFYAKCKQIIQNKHGIPHQYVAKSSANRDSIMQLVMEIALKSGVDPWLLDYSINEFNVLGIYTYTNPNTRDKRIFINLLRNDGKIIKQYDPILPEEFESIMGDLVKDVKSKHVLYIFSYDRLGLVKVFSNFISQNEPPHDYVISTLTDENELRVFETWKPKLAPRFGKQAKQISSSPFEAYEAAPQGVSLKSGDKINYLLTGRTIEKNALKRGCPTPIRFEVVDKKGAFWEQLNIADYLIHMCMLGRASGHMTRMPSPIYYLQSYASYHSNFGTPDNDKIKKGTFYI